MKFFKQEEPNITFISKIPGLTSIPECQPRPANKFIPDWWYKTPTKKSHFDMDTGVFSGNVKLCPSFPDYFSRGFIIPMWCDTYLYYDSETEEYKWRSANENFRWSAHPNFQFLDDVDFNFMGKPAQFIFKPDSPWNVVTPKGWSIYQLPLFFHHSNEFSVFPGVIDTDVWHEVNPQIMLLQDKKEVFIPRGTPFVQYIPFKRESLELDVREQTEADKKMLEAHYLNITSTMTFRNGYRRLQKERDEK